MKRTHKIYDNIANLKLIKAKLKQTETESFKNIGHYWL